MTEATICSMAGGDQTWRRWELDLFGKREVPPLTRATLARWLHSEALRRAQAEGPRTGRDGCGRGLGVDSMSRRCGRAPSGGRRRDSSAHTPGALSPKTDT